MAVSLEYRDKLAFIDLGDGENRFTIEFLKEFTAHLDEAVLEGVQGVVTTASGKFYSNGLDVEWMLANPDRFGGYVEQVHQLFARVLAFPIPTVAAMSGHAFGAAAVLALAHDYRIMRADRGYFCLPEVDLRMRFTKGFAAVIQGKLIPQVALTAMTTGRRYGGADAQAAGIVDATAVDGALADTAIALLGQIGGKDQNTLTGIKTTMFASALAALAEPID